MRHDSISMGCALLAALALGACGGDDDEGTGTQGGTSGTDGSTSTSTTDSTSTSTTAGTGTTSTSTTDASTTTDATSGSTTDEGSSSGSTGSASMLTFFVTSTGSGTDGGSLGGLTGADAKCQGLAEAGGAGDHTWQAYLSTDAEDARDRIGSGPWYNSAGALIAADVAALHDDGLSNGDPQHVLDENGDVVPASEHDILTGSLEDGTVDGTNHCDNWTSSDGGDDARVGHSDQPKNFSHSWNSAHVVNGCTEGDLEGPNGAGRIYCFAID